MYYYQPIPIVEEHNVLHTIVQVHFLGSSSFLTSLLVAPLPEDATEAAAAAAAALCFFLALTETRVLPPGTPFVDCLEAAGAAISTPESARAERASCAAALWLDSTVAPTPWETWNKEKRHKQDVFI
jgi:hypothetical protein